MDCLSIPDSSEYNCENLWGLNCTQAPFDFARMWNITQRIQGYCPSDPRLFRANNLLATPNNAALTGKACKAIVGSGWAPYPAGDIWSRLTTWKFPLLQLVASSPRPPLGHAVETFVILHQLGDPVGTIKDLLRVLSKCQDRANFWREHLNGQEHRLTADQLDRAWKAFTIIVVSYDEWGQGDYVQNILLEML